MQSYIPEICDTCHQTKTYLLAIDMGTVDIVKTIARFIGKKGINAVHPRKEIEGKLLTSNQVGNLSRPRFHGLVARIKGEPGNYCLTTKGAKFLRGESIPRFAIISKEQKRQIGYWCEDELRCTIKDFPNQKEYWEGINYIIEEGRIITQPA